MNESLEDFVRSMKPRIRLRPDGVISSVSWRHMPGACACVHPFDPAMMNIRLAYLSRPAKIVRPQPWAEE